MGEESVSYSCGIKGWGGVGGRYIGIGGGGSVLGRAKFKLVFVFIFATIGVAGGRSRSAVSYDVMYLPFRYIWCDVWLGCPLTG